MCISLVALLASCGGGSGTTYGGGDTSTDGGGVTTSATGSVSSANAGTVVLTLSSSTVSASTPGTVTALVKGGDGLPIANAIVTFNVANGTATVSPARVLTDSVGNASATVSPSAGALGADIVTASATISGTTLTTQSAFTVSAVSVTLGAATAVPVNVDAYGSSVLTVDVVGASVSAPVTLAFSSSCANAGKATLSPSQITSTSASANITYQDKGCGGADRINVSILGNAQQQKSIDLVVAAPTAQSLEFVSSLPDKICLKGSGCPAVSIVAFRLKDEFGNGLAGRDVQFDLDVPNVASLSSPTGKTDNAGLVSVSVSALTIPSPVRVRASLLNVNAIALSTVSNVLAINAGLPTNRAFSFAATAANIDGWTIDGVESQIRVQLNDRFGNAVPDGTSVSFVAEGASVIPARCVTADGVCATKFISSNFRPINGRVTVVAFAQGEESFGDIDGNNIYDAFPAPGESFEDLGEVFVDKNEDGALQRDKGEYIVGSAANGIWDGNTFVRASRVFVLSDSATAPRVFLVGPLGCGSTQMTNLNLLNFQPTTGGPNVCRITQNICLRDGNSAADEGDPDQPPGRAIGNPLPAGTTLTVTTKAQGVSAVVDNSPIGSTTKPTEHRVRVELSDCSKPLTAGGSLDLVVNIPGTQGQAARTYTLTVGSIQ
jgi:hypothetical protein